MRCSSITCSSLATPTGTGKAKCAKVWRVWQCSSSSACQIMTTTDEHARGEAECQGTHRAVITSAMRKYIGDMDESGLAPRHIWSGLRRFTAARL
eukprot:jgi/Phyca11/101091/e_gw1.5.413.1